MSVEPCADTPKKHGSLILWKPGQSGNPKGRPKGARNKLGEAFIGDVFELWAEHGPAILKKAAIDDPSAFVRMIASLMPKNIKLEVDASEAFVELLREEQARRAVA